MKTKKKKIIRLFPSSDSAENVIIDIEAFRRVRREMIKPTKINRSFSLTSYVFPRMGGHSTVEVETMRELVLTDVEKIFMRD